MKRVFTFTIFFFLLGALTSVAQNSCIQELDNENYAHYKKIVNKINLPKSYDGSFPTVRLSLNRIRNSAGSNQDIISWLEIYDIIQGMADFFNGEICFTVANENNIDENDFFTLNVPGTPTSSGSILWNDTYLDLLETNVADNNSIRLYFMKTSAGSISTNPFWDQSPTDDFTVTLFQESSSGAPSHNAEILAHEIGHCLGLVHTHQFRTVNSNDIRENVSRSGINKNCDTEGDLLCGTAADFGISGLNDSELFDQSACSYIGDKLDPVGTPYDIDLKNIMSYSLANCMDYFTQDQLDRALSFINNTNLIDQVIIPEDVILSENQSNGYFNYIAENSITSTASYSLQNVGKVFYSARSEIVLSPGFSITFTTNFNKFTAKIIDYSECFDPLNRIDGFTESTEIKNRSISKNLSDTDFYMYPNPIDSDFLYFKFEYNFPLRIIIRDINGSKVICQSVFPDVYKINISTLHSGIYIVSTDSEKDQNSKRLIVL